MKIESLPNSLITNLTFPLSSYLMNRKGIVSRYRRLMKSQWYSEDQLINIQLSKLKKLLVYAEKYVPFYSQRFKEIGFKAQDFKSFDEFKLIPVLSRQDVIAHYKDMVDIRFKDSIPVANQSLRGPGVPDSLARFKKHKLVRNTSSGSTGAPTLFYEDGSQTAINWANELRLRTWFDIKPGEKEARMVRLSNDFVDNDRNNKIRKLLWNQLILPGVNLGEEDYQIAYDKLNEFKPKVLWGFTSALVGLADFIERRNLSIENIAPGLIITWAAPLYDHEREKLLRVFNCYLTNIYGTREIGHIAARCPHDTLHINQESLLIEEDNTGDKEKELLGTALEITPMPFIRYRTGDLGEVKSSDCACGRKLHRIHNFLGRTGEIFFSKDRKMISPNFWCRTFMNESLSGVIRRFQVIYRKDKDIDLLVEQGPGYNKEIEDGLVARFYKSFSKETKLNIKPVSEIKPMTSGKYQMVKHEK